MEELGVGGGSGVVGLAGGTEIIVFDHARDSNPCERLPRRLDAVRQDDLDARTPDVRTRWLPTSTQSAADFANTLDDAQPEAREALIRGVLNHEALARIADDKNGPASNWVDPEDWKEWRSILTRLRAVLAPAPPSIALFDGQP
ncbi:hypothetical protein PV379_13585 [Streptomyces caniscabiei]|uniref:hypothetical protein n=1 Tax=Streptomyces caniscabiei TaxID=2746961 RepID=UPI0029A9487E|nr:hypothetical protein [Streptomyces caniscabiei]MDX2605742.1 hypothetical protein [Streptomyces caniscabiei]MDX2733728.1 hypothetical protein [Streptomyces caniscabiei]MDX2778338.1 hypothetical protein [Streptomyces caniscabiei]